MSRTPRAFILTLGIVTSALCSFSAAGPASADTALFAVEAAQTDVPPKIDGTLDDPAWRTAAHVDLAWDFQFRRPASEKTDAYVLADKQFIYVAIVAQQSEPITATLHTNDVTLSADDLVRVYLWPGGDHGFEYGFVSTPIGTRNEFSTENNSFAPQWTAVGKVTPTGYIITERIPLNVMRGDGRSSWRLQFERLVHVTGQDFEWAHDPGQNGVDNSTYVGYLNSMAVASVSTRTKPRVGVYGLGLLGAPAVGDRVRAGADISVPITNTTSFFSTLFPDYSNVDLDQQTISPTAFTRQINEVRPFFTQGLNAYNGFNCNDCVDVPFLYTPNIPTPRDGYAIDGEQGLAQFGAFDALGAGQRTDNAQTLTWQTPDKHFGIDALRFATDYPGYADDTFISQFVAGNRHNSSFYVTEGGERGSNDVGNSSLGYYREYGINLFTQKFGFFPAYHDVGPSFLPRDGFFQINDVHGPTLFVRNEWDNSPTSYVQSYQVEQDVEHYRNSNGQPNFGGAFTQLSINTRSQYQFQLDSGFNYLRLPDGYLARITQAGGSLSYGEKTNVPTTITYDLGRFGPGYLRSATRLTTIRIGPRGTLALEGDNTNQTTDDGLKHVQWLERASVAYQLNSGSSLAVGVRRIIGTAPLLVSPTPINLKNAEMVPPLDDSNVSLAYYRRVGQNELYIVYGDPNQLSTYPALIVKFVHYFGAGKGT